MDESYGAGLLAALVASADDAIVSKDLNGFVTSWNRAAERLFGYTSAEMVGQHITRIIPADRHPEEAYVLSRVRQGLEVDHFETVRQHKDGSLLEISLTVSPIRAEDGRIVGASKIARDISERRRMERELMRLAAIVESSEDAIVGKDLTGVIYSWNTAAERMFGYTEAEAIGRSITLIIPEDRLAEEQGVLACVRAGESVRHFETVRRTKDGRLIDVSLSVSPIRAKTGQVIGASKIARDITEQKRLRLALEESSRAKDAFLAMLGHELRNPLAPILTALQLMRLRGMTEAEDERAMIERQVKHVVSLVDDLLDVSRITQGKVQLHKRRLHLADAVDKAIEMASPLLEQRQHHLTIDVPRDAPLAIDGDLDRFAQVIANLLNNAAKYTEVGGRICVIGAVAEGRVTLRVRDNGIGISEEMLPRVFDEFAQEGQAIDRAQGGLGLGLAIVRSLVELHGGQVIARSEGTGAGAEFEIRMPPAASAAAVPTDTAPPLLSSNQPKQGWRILVVDDNQDAARLMSAMLSHRGYATCVALDGPSALGVARDFKPDIALLDIGLPGMDGYELAGRLREIPGLADLRLIAVTGYGQESDRQRTAAAGFATHLVKPIDLMELLKHFDALQHVDPDRTSSASLP
jgi:PAS domain S-box-containing protein